MATRQVEQGNAAKDKLAPAPQHETKAQLPVPKEPVTFTVNGQTYEILRFEGKGPNLAQTIDMAKSMKGRQMLTFEEAREISNDTGELNTAFTNALKPGEWSYIRDPESETRFGARVLLHNGDIKWMYAGIDGDGPEDNASPVVILKVTGEDATPQQRLIGGYKEQLEKVVACALALAVAHDGEFEGKKETDSWWQN